MVERFCGRQRVVAPELYGPLYGTLCVLGRIAALVGDTVAFVFGIVNLLPEENEQLTPIGW